MMGRGNKADRGSYSSRYASQGGGGGRNSASGKENGNSHALEKNLSPTYVPTSQEEKSITKGSTVTSPNELSVGAFTPAASAVTGKLEGFPQHGAPVDANKSSKVGQGTMDNHGLPKPASSDSAASFASVPSSGTDLSASDPVLPSQDSQPIGALGGIRSEVQSQRAPVAANSNDSKTISGQRA
nr:GBF-interacting protein 1-like isoform X4 [Ipomoea batatas]